MLLMTIATKSFALVAVAANRVATTGIAIVAGVTKALIHRREVLRLSELDERSLKDIGLVRSDVEGALATSWLNDPSMVLAERSNASSGVALARRDEAVRLSQTAAPAVQIRPVAAKTGTPIACSA